MSEARTGQTAAACITYHMLFQSHKNKDTLTKVQKLQMKRTAVKRSFKTLLSDSRLSPYSELNFESKDQVNMFSIVFGVDLIIYTLAGNLCRLVAYSDAEQNREQASCQLLFHENRYVYLLDKSKFEHLFTCNICQRTISESNTSSHMKMCRYRMSFNRANPERANTILRHKPRPVHCSKI
jgi:hypothetical protein